MHMNIGFQNWQGRMIIVCEGSGILGLLEEILMYKRGGCVEPVQNTCWASYGAKIDCWTDSIGVAILLPRCCLSISLHR